MVIEVCLISTIEDEGWWLISRAEAAAAFYYLWCKLIWQTESIWQGMTWNESNWMIWQLYSQSHGIIKYEIETICGLNDGKVKGRGHEQESFGNRNRARRSSGFPSSPSSSRNIAFIIIMSLSWMDPHPPPPRTVFEAEFIHPFIPPHPVHRVVRSSLIHFSLWLRNESCEMID